MCNHNSEEFELNNKCTHLVRQTEKKMAQNGRRGIDYDLPMVVDNTAQLRTIINALDQAVRIMLDNNRELKQANEYLRKLVMNTSSLR